ncbi:imidazole glycerol phosphate synthase subunit HisH [Candidatus Micrarchaeota archaeon]|nr:imidazole glycerol phosphate synthase subunit HisH [Candidatus Micrarchaeota archaeon]
MLVIVDCGIGNLGSIQNMLKRIGVRATVSSDPAVIEAAEKLFLPGVGAFDSGMQALNQSGLIPVLNKKVLKDKTPVLGICLGMQLLSKKSEEGKLPGLGWIQGETVRFKFNPKMGLKIPHMGWNRVSIQQEDPLFSGMPDDSRFYFVHSYHVVCQNPSDVAATTPYGYDFTSSVAKGNIFGVQFHPEKSHSFGMKLLENFVRKA